ncbi:hypothetical protein PV10_08837 [Exophiala mesophila]|uniref:Association with the SNF1 complex (ASC) domain-containing protein n=1 Tax=Exophiala mesophila TaxID=212818 RepID=A0A0D1ZR45_EXOME|nr:uncharacterized protein PV10_08837 [Exophiala mesophila]KIV89258.1 hypothetical protein PV10_08837 [Exophiala mesophila]
MGNQQSNEKTSSSAPTRSNTLHTDKDRDRKINRRVSIQALSHGRATPIDPSASQEIAVAHTTSQHLDQPALHQYLQQTSSPEQYAKVGKMIERSASRSKRDPKQDSPAQRQSPSQSQSPITVPQTSTPIAMPASRSKQDTFDERLEEQRNAYVDRRYTPVARTRPPRLPLPIADVAIPESPTLLPVDKSNADVPIFDNDDPISPVEPTLRRKSSMLSQTTTEEDVEDELQPFAQDVSRTVPTVIEWNHPGHKVYVTGTFANWDKKYRLHPRKNATGMYTTINLPSGTHHLKFVVDGEMVTSPSLPTAVDFNNFLVNYIEIATEDLSKTRRESAQPGQKPIPGLSSDDQDQSRFETSSPAESDTDSVHAEEIAPGDFRQIIPQALIDIELPEDDPRYQAAQKILTDISGPPTLPLFLSRSILNGILPVKDDNSVLTLPNHTVLNHLMTSSVKNGVLATSVTTRYKKKYVTTISFKPVPKFRQEG